MKTELKLKLIELAGLTPQSINEHYERMLNGWKFDNSDEVWIDGRLIDLDEKMLIGIGMYNIKPKPKEMIVSELKAGFKLTEKLFIESLIYKLNSFVNIDKPEDVSQMRVNLFLRFLKERQSIFYADVFDFMVDVSRLKYCDVIHGYQEQIKLFSEVDRLKKVLEFADKTRTEILNQILDSDFHYSASWNLPIGDDFGDPNSNEILNDRIRQLTLSVSVLDYYQTFDISLLPTNVLCGKHWQFDFSLLPNSNDIINLVANIGYVNFLLIEIEKCNDIIQQIESKKQLPSTDYERIARNIIANKYPVIVQGAICETFEDYIEQERKHCTDPNFYKTFIRVMGEVCTAKNQGNYGTGLDAFISDKYKLVLDYCTSQMPQNKRETNDSKTKHTYPRLSDKFDAKRVYNSFFKGEVCLCTFECFNDWFVDGYVAETITPKLMGRRSSKTGNPTLSIAQIRKFMEIITDNETDLKDGYFNNVFKLNLNNTQTAKNLDTVLIDKLKLCEK